MRRIKRSRALILALVLILLVVALPASAAVVETIEQLQQTAQSSGYEGGGQTFYPHTSGYVTSITFWPADSSSGTLSIYQGTPWGGTLLYSQPASWSNGSQTTITLDTPVAVSAWTMHSFVFQTVVESGGDFFYASGYTLGYDPYSEGDVFFHAEPSGWFPMDYYDAYFRVVIDDQGPAIPSSSSPTETFKEPWFWAPSPLNNDAFSMYPANAAGTPACGAFDAGWWGIKYIDPGNFEGCPTDPGDVTVMCFNENGEWSADYVTQEVVDGVLQATIYQHGLCALFPE